MTGVADYHFTLRPKCCSTCAQYFLFHTVPNQAVLPTSYKDGYQTGKVQTRASSPSPPRALSHQAFYLSSSDNGKAHEEKQTKKTKEKMEYKLKMPV